MSKKFSHSVDKMARDFAGDSKKLPIKAIQETVKIFKEAAKTS